jgi:hypothetical protein
MFHLSSLRQIYMWWVRNCTVYLQLSSDVYINLFIVYGLFNGTADVSHCIASTDLTTNEYVDKSCRGLICATNFLESSLRIGI